MRDMQNLDFQPADVFFLIHSKNDISKAIAKVTGSRWSHAGMIMEIGVFATYTIETCDFNVWTNHFEKYLTDQWVEMEVFRPKRELPMKEQIVKAAQKTHGTIYGFLQFISLGIRARISRLIPNFIRQGIVCNQVVLSGLTVSDIPGFQGIDPESMDQEELYKLVKNSPDFELVFEKKAGEKWAF